MGSTVSPVCSCGAVGAPQAGEDDVPSQVLEMLLLLMQLLSMLFEGSGDGAEPGGDGPAGGQNSGPNMNFQLFGGAGGGSSNFDAGPNGRLGQWSGAIGNAAAATGLDPNLIGAVVWAESRGNANTRSQNADGTTDLGLMQISQERWKKDVLPKLSAEDRARIKQATGKDAEDLDMNNPEDNVIGGAFELKQHIAREGSIKAGLAYYVHGGNPSIGNPNYVNEVMEFWRTLESGGQLRD